jgi:predicted S18 family serine protease
MKSEKVVRAGFILSIVFCSFFIAGCGPKMLPPHDKISDAEMALDRAREEGAGDYDPADLKSAEDKLARAKKAMSDRDYKTATRLAEESAIDAQTAEARSKAAKAKELSRQMEENVDSLRKEVERFQ